MVILPANLGYCCCFRLETAVVSSIRLKVSLIKFHVVNHNNWMITQCFLGKKKKKNTNLEIWSCVQFCAVFCSPGTIIYPLWDDMHLVWQNQCQIYYGKNKKQSKCDHRMAFLLQNNRLHSSKWAWAFCSIKLPLAKQGDSKGDCFFAPDNIDHQLRISFSLVSGLSVEYVTEIYRNSSTTKNYIRYFVYGIDIKLHDAFAEGVSLWAPISVDFDDDIPKYEILISRLVGFNWELGIVFIGHHASMKNNSDQTPICTHKYY